MTLISFGGLSTIRQTDHQFVSVLEDLLYMTKQKRRKLKFVSVLGTDHSSLAKPEGNMLKHPLYDFWLLCEVFIAEHFFFILATIKIHYTAASNTSRIAFRIGS